jgi:hypothetical protein
VNQNTPASSKSQTIQPKPSRSWPAQTPQETARRPRAYTITRTCSRLPSLRLKNITRNAEFFDIALRL